MITKFLLFSSYGGLTGFVMWLVIYQLYKTPRIGFDGPAGLAMVFSIVVGAVLFLIAAGVNKLIRKK